VLRTRADINEAAVHLHDVVNRGQSETGIVAVLFGRKKRLKNPADRFRHHAAAGVADS